MCIISRGSLGDFSRGDLGAQKRGAKENLASAKPKIATGRDKAENCTSGGAQKSATEQGGNL